MFSLFGSVRSARGASEASGGGAGFNAWRRGSRRSKSTGVFRSNGSPFSLSLMSAPSPEFAASPKLAVRRRPLRRREAPHALGGGQELGGPVRLVGRDRLRQLRDRLRQALLGREVTVSFVHH